MFSLVTPRDFARSIAWARRQPPNPITAALKKHSMTSKITKTEVVAALAEAEPKAGWSTLDNTPVTISGGSLRALVEAAKCARYYQSWLGSDSYMFLQEPEAVVPDDDN
jgi:hypothetical protein